MEIKCVWEHHGKDSLLYSSNFIGAFTRGESLEIAVNKMENEIKAYLRWKNENAPEDFEIYIDEEWNSDLNICEADTDVIFEKEKEKLSVEEYLELKKLALKSAKDFFILYNSIEDKHTSAVSEKMTFLGPRPRTAYEMYKHTKEVNSYYFGEIGVSADNEGTIYECRERGFELLEKQADFLNNDVVVGSYNEEWSLRKVLRRFIWHDRIHGKAMYRMALKTFGGDSVADVFRFKS